MNTDIAEGKWKQLRGKIQQKWGDISDDEMDKINCSRQEFVGMMQEKHGKTKDEAEKAFDELSNS